MKCHTLVISDLHLGSRVCRRDKVIEVLRRNQFHTLVINGDLFDSNDTDKLTGKDFEILHLLEKITHRHRVLLVGGNHGRKLDILARDIGIELLDEYAFTLGDNRFLCLHGDEFDMFVKYFPSTSDMFGRLYYLIQKIGGKKQKGPVVAKMITKKVLGVPRRQERLALKRGASDGANVVICSHTHIPHMEMKSGILFINTGSFCDHPSNFVAISQTGETELVAV